MDIINDQEFMIRRLIQAHRGFFFPVVPGQNEAFFVRAAMFHQRSTIMNELHLTAIQIQIYTQ